MGWKKLTFVLIPHSQEHVKQFRVHRNTAYGVGIFLVVAICVMIFYIIGFNGKEFNISRTQDLIEKNRFIEEQVALFDTTVAKLDMKVAHLESLNTEIISESGISQVDLERFTDTSLPGMSSDQSRNTDYILSLIDRLDFKSAAFETNFSTLYKACIDNPDYIKRVPSIRPSRGTITREFGRTFDAMGSIESSHPGVDITWDEGTPVIATADGVIEENTTNKELGKYIIIDHQNGYKTRYAHLQTLPQMKKKIRLKKGDTVTRGQQIGSIGRTGISIAATPSHIMYSVYHKGIPVNPVDYFFASDLLASALSLQASSGQGQGPRVE